MAFSFTDLIAPIGDLLGGALGASTAASRQEDAQAFSAQQFASRYQTTVKDMQAAGLNPMLAYSQGGGNSPTSAAAGASSFGSPGSSFTQAKLASAQEANIHADTVNKQAQAENIRADTLLKVAQEGLTGASADQTRTNIGYLEMQSKRISEELKNIPKEGARLDALVKNLAEEFKLIRQKTATETQATNQMRWLATRTMLESDLTGFDVKAIEKFDNFGKEYQQYRPIIELIKSIFQPRGGGITINK